MHPPRGASFFWRNDDKRLPLRDKFIKMLLIIENGK